MDFNGKPALTKQQSRTNLQLQAQAWFLSDQVTPGSFLWVCSWLGLNAEKIRRRLSQPIDITAAQSEVLAEERRRQQAKWEG